jgi:hypothetical protein
LLCRYSSPSSSCRVYLRASSSLKRPKRCTIDAMEPPGGGWVGAAEGRQAEGRMSAGWVP